MKYAMRPSMTPSIAASRRSSRASRGRGGTGFFVIVRLNGVDLMHLLAGVHVPLEPVMVRAYVPLGAFAPTLILIIEFAVLPAGGLTEGGENVAVTSYGSPVAFSVTFWLNNPIDVTVTMAVLDSVVLIVREFGETEISKSASARVTMRVTRTHFTTGGVDVSCPVTFMT